MNTDTTALLKRIDLELRDWESWSEDHDDTPITTIALLREIRNHLAAAPTNAGVLRDALAKISLSEADSTTSTEEKLRCMGKLAREALAATPASGAPDHFPDAGKMVPLPSDVEANVSNAAEPFLYTSPESVKKTEGSMQVLGDATDDEIREWLERHDLEHAIRGTDARAAFEDAQTFRPEQSRVQDSGAEPGGSKEERCGDCRRGDFRVYNAARGLLTCAHCGQFKQLPTTQPTKPEADAQAGQGEALPAECMEFVRIVGDEFGNESGVQLRELFRSLATPPPARSSDEVIGWQVRVWHERSYPDWSKWQNAGRKEYDDVLATGKYWEYDTVEVRELFAGPARTRSSDEAVITGILLDGMQHDPPGKMTVSVTTADGRTIPVIQDSSNVIGHHVAMRHVMELVARNRGTAEGGA